MYLIGYDVGSSAVKASLLEVETGKTVASAASPEEEMPISAPRPGWAEQDPAMWWENLVNATRLIRSVVGPRFSETRALGLSYQMHGLVVLDRSGKVLRPAIIWCDSRAVDIGRKALDELGEERCLRELLNSPGNFTASKLKWVKDNEPELYRNVAGVALPGDYIAYRMTGDLRTTPSGLSEGILWSYLQGKPASLVLDHFGFSPDLFPPLVPTLSVQGSLNREAADELGLPEGTPVSYRSGDQPNNALSLNVLEPGEVAATAGTSGGVYAVGDRPSYDPQFRYNTFVHVNHSEESPRYGNLLCLNGAGILYRWLRQNLGLGYEDMNRAAGDAPAGSEGLYFLPYGNGAERSLENRDIGSSLHGLSFNIHGQGHLLRSAQEGIVFALNHGLDIMRETGIPVEAVRAGHANMFRSSLFADIFATVTGTRVELFETDGAQGAARGAGIGAGIYSFRDAFTGLERISVVQPSEDLTERYRDSYGKWRELLPAVNSGPED